MKAAVFQRHGDIDQVQLADLPMPDVSDDGLVVQVHAASVNSWDWDHLRGWPVGRFLPAGKQPKRLGGDFAGVVAAVGKKVQGFAVGQRVFGDVSGGPWGAFAEYLAVPARLVAPLPENIDFHTAAALPQAGLLALQAIRGRVKPGARVLINGAAGGAGTFAIQLAKLAGAKVTGVDHGGKFQTMRNAGADEVLDYTRTDFTQTGKQYDLVIDLVARRRTAQHRRALAPGGTYLLIGGTLPAIINLATVGVISSLWSNRKLRLLAWRASPQDLGELASHVMDAKVVPVRGGTYALHDIGAALSQVRDGAVEGKIVISITG